LIDRAGSHAGGGIGFFVFLLCFEHPFSARKNNKFACEQTLTNYFGNCGLQCQNGGVCIEVVGEGFECLCSDPNWAGEFCDVPVVCYESNNPCMNGGVCQLSGGAAVCVCPGNFVGDSCETAIDDFVSSTVAELLTDCRFGLPCNNGDCTLSGEGFYECSCFPGWGGLTCDVSLACSPNPCGTDGLCITDAQGLPVCYCAAGWIGDSCEWTLEEYFTSDCRVKGCENDGSCDLVGDLYVCRCSSGFAGDWCETPMECEPNPCTNNGACSVDDGVAVCTCTGAYKGELCEDSLLDIASNLADMADELSGLNPTVTFGGYQVGSSSASFVSMTVLALLSVWYILF